MFKTRSGFSIVNHCLMGWGCHYVWRNASVLSKSYGGLGDRIRRKRESGLSKRLGEDDARNILRLRRIAKDIAALACSLV